MYIKRIFDDLEPFHNDPKSLDYYLRFVHYFVTGLYYILYVGNMEKTKKFHSNKNPVRRLRIKLEAHKNQEGLKRITEKYGNSVEGYNFHNVLLPDMSNDKEYLDVMYRIYEDTLKVYCEYEDDYHWHIVDKLERRLPEGTYCYIGKNGEDITVKPGHTVIDAGAWIGDFSAYAAKKGAKVYAFEPMPKAIEYLKQTAELNGNITIVPFGLGNQIAVLKFKEESVASRFDDSGESEINVTTLDAWAEENSIEKIDFIKADIEGHERYMLMGATRILKIHQPILSICAYHLPDDPVILRQIILEANPNYKIIKRKKKLFAFVPNK